MSTLRPSRKPSLNFFRRKTKCVKPEIVIAPPSPTISWDLPGTPVASPKRYNDWMPPQTTGGSIDSGYGSLPSPRSDCCRTNTQSPPPAYENVPVVMDSPQSPKLPKSPGLGQKLSTMAAELPSAHQVLSKKKSVHFQPLERSVRHSEMVPQVVMGGDNSSEGISNSEGVIVRSRSNSLRKELPPLDTAKATSVRSSPAPVLVSSNALQTSLLNIETDSPTLPSVEPLDNSIEASSAISDLSEEKHQIPVTVFQTDGQCWIFPNVTIEEALTRIKSDSIKIEALYDGNDNERATGAATSANTSPSSANTTSSAGSGNNKRRRNGGKRNVNSKSTRRRTNAGSPETGPRTLRYGCPFAKHNPERYAGVYKSCTVGPGIEWKYLSEHLTRVHNASAKCIYCKKVWSTSDWETELKQHYDSGECPELDSIMSKPECMSRAQESVYKSDVNETGHPDKRWVTLYMRLFAGAWPIPNPRYNYYTARHRIITPTRSPSNSPVDSIGNSHSNSPGTAPAQTRTWLVFSQNTDEDEFYSPVSAPSSATYDAGGIFSSNVARLRYEPAVASLPPFSFGPMDLGTALEQQSPDYSTPPWPQSQLTYQYNDMYDFGGTGFSGSESTLVMPDTLEQGLEHLDKWTGQNVPVLDVENERPAF